jgi:hypothetical protein
MPKLMGHAQPSAGAPGGAWASARNVEGDAADAIDLMEWVRDMIRESGFFENPLTIRRRSKLRKCQEHEQYYDFVLIDWA